MTPEKAKKIIEDMFAAMGISCESIEYSSDDKKGHSFSVKSAELEGFCRGREEYYKEMTHLLKRIFNKDVKFGEDSFKCSIDINGQQNKVDEQIKLKATDAATKARSLKTDVEMEPMSSYERMVVHSVLADYSDLGTASTGEGRERRVVVKYLPI